MPANLKPNRGVKPAPHPLVMPVGSQTVDPEIASIERDLITRIHQGDSSALEEIHRGTYSSLVALAYGYLKSVEAAKDVVSEVFLNVWRDKKDWHPRERIHSYLCGAVRNRCLNNIRARRIREEYAVNAIVEGETPAMGEIPEPVDVTLEKEDLVAAVWRTIEKLPANRREVMVLRWKERLSYEEIASIMNINVAAVHNLMSRTLKTLRQMFPASFSEER